MRGVSSDTLSFVGRLGKASIASFGVAVDKKGTFASV